jgi:adenine-specific DNA-methyltransferase
VLRFNERIARARALLEKATRASLTKEEAAELAEQLEAEQPWLEWAGKREQPFFEVEPVALHLHERVSAQAILKSVRREDVQRDLFAEPALAARQARAYYQHDVEWANRLIVGDRLQVMTSLARREGLAGRVQMIYLDPPYGIKFSSNWQKRLLLPCSASAGMTALPDRVSYLGSSQRPVAHGQETTTPAQPGGQGA